MLQGISLPRQARDKHRESSTQKERAAFSYCPSELVRGKVRNQHLGGGLRGRGRKLSVRERPSFLRHAYTKNQTEYLPRQARDKQNTGNVERFETNGTRVCVQGLYPCSDRGQLQASIPAVQVSKKNAVFLRCHLHLKRTFYQDRLGTNIGKTLQKRTVLLQRGSTQGKKTRLCAMPFDTQNDHFTKTGSEQT
jgi:hypothetical protein